MVTVSQVTNPQTIAARIVIGWMAREAAINYLTNECVFDEPLTAELAEQKWAEYRDKVAALPERDCSAPIRLPMSAAEQRHADDFMRFHRQYINGSVREVIKINPLNLVTHQPHVLLDQAGAYAADATDAAHFARHSLATARGVHNIQIQAGLNAMDIIVPHGEFAFAFEPQTSAWGVIETARHISVTAFQNRMLLWAGYHRSYAFMDRANPDGIERSLLVALTTDADFLLSPQSPNQGLRATVCGLRPTLFRDFFDGDLFMTVSLKRKRFVLQVRAQCVGVDP